jgi:succinoglycan biosynthesis protein ExoV
MRLQYYTEQNFGDTLNPLIFHHVLPNFFDNDPSVDFFGIGSIIGFDMVTEAKKKVFFSSGFAYGQLPTIDETYDFICVRGPNTAQALNLDKSTIVTDGAALLRELKLPARKKKYPFSFMPHWESELKYPWRKLCEEAGIHYISPVDDTIKVLHELQETEIVLAEAMHAAIVADTLRVPWIPVRAYNGINAFKWSDWSLSLDMPYEPNTIRSMYKVNDFVIKILKEKWSALPSPFYKPIAHAYVGYQDLFVTKEVVRQLEQLKTKKQYLSNDTIFNNRVDQLLDKLEIVKQKYKK